ncbi:hypothetical protein [Paractinoplanes brasiliensis]|uniref:Uncharacterized protein n=1 Tax=Paractinoplanes brasiliensis TaxID=52695 RepID=A0A4R6JBT1_9ACTN|nr:hypothetical protein [Actinoplanes brasiliensis]TDO31975.1 hypothetical protein C8E87_7414 [Actinoplanes brasiliensis]GID28019.1 hypothetical protein Abr02nite_30020 [Actinoplanes brasiliensis]
MSVSEEQQRTAQDQQQDGVGAALDIVFDVAKWLVQNSGAVGGLWAQMTHGVTNIKEWVNETNYEVEVWKLDGGFRRKDHFRIPPRQTVHAELWVSWADNEQQYADHHVTIVVGGQPLAYLHQSGKLVRFNTVEEFADGAVGVPGACGAGGDRRAVIGADPQGRRGFMISTL